MFNAARRRSLGRAAAIITTVAAGLVPLAATTAPAQARGFTYTTSPYCGTTIKKATGGSWKCSFSDDFNGSAVDGTKWSPLLTSKTGVATPECRIDSKETISVSNGAVHLTTLRKPGYVCSTMAGTYTTDFVGGGIQSKGKFSQTAGRFEARIQFPGSTTAGIHSAWWLWPEKQLYGSLGGELDVAEWRSGQADHVLPAVHYDEGGVPSTFANLDCVVSTPGAWHTYALEWVGGTMTFIYDGAVVLTKQILDGGGLVAPAPFDEPFFMILNNGIGGGLNVPTDSTALPSTMNVDYVRVWK
ncbi:glycoside hydrolase family 16 protein [Nocardioides jiangxiensis]|uniref:Glycoside hydrolase family 16 protein n=1 Tax=Nocardioides jiangxiensis TaxID=3064524 RepID=A0ABT9B2Q2_9ACTN|nr:glycoside hydrolase family 16 protein [Nocardioides sp. WY-20]MDO7869121.1 glycoside hydrolase family 16 protein [Nocardioides sp. WY-20]